MIGIFVPGMAGLAFQIDSNANQPRWRARLDAGPFRGYVFPAWSVMVKSCVIGAEKSLRQAKVPLAIMRGQAVPKSWADMSAVAAAPAVDVSKYKMPVAMRVFICRLCLLYV